MRPRTPGRNEGGVGRVAGGIRESGITAHEFLEANGAVSTAKYEGMGYAQIQKPKLYASCRQENMDRLFDFLKEQKREDLIKTTVMPQTLSSFTKECIEGGVEVPEFISYYLKPTIRLYA